jgi:Ca2+-binding EF-hand superfamily protein
MYLLVIMQPRLGPAISLNQVKQFIYDYDTSCTGALDFEDFLEFLGDYQVTLKQKRDRALGHYNEQLQV